MESYPLVFFVVALIIFLIGFLGYFGIMLTQWYSPTAYQDFIDLCSIANMSVLLFDDDLKGYYIHGQSSNGSADVDSRQLRLGLYQETIGNSSIRGICNDYKDDQTFEMSMPKKVVEEYREIFLSKVQ